MAAGQPVLDTDCQVQRVVASDAAPRLLWLSCPPPNLEPCMLSISGLSHSYDGRTRALDDVTLRIPRGMFGLLGPNGAGKSTLMRCVAALQIPTSGRILFDGIDVIAAPMALRRTLGYLPQDFGVYPRVSVADMLDHMAVLKGISGRGERRQTVETLLRQVNLWHVRKSALASLS